LHLRIFLIIFCNFLLSVISEIKFFKFSFNYRNFRGLTWVWLCV
jgi:hypothetical protein